MPVIFASTLLILPGFLFNMIDQLAADAELGRRPRRTSSSAAAAGCTTSCTSSLIYFFCYFWVAITFNPKDMADNLKDYGSFIPGYRPGQAHRRLPRTRADADHLRRGGVPGGHRHHPERDLRASWTSTTAVASFYGGTGLLIVISVALDLVQKINSHLVMRNYPGLTDD